jgi:hydroxymethylpyrimidine/phosphomethylpyrimidine kinase
MSRTPPVALSIAGSDSGGGAGIQADLKTFAALGVFGTSAVTAVTAQSTRGVDRVDVLAPGSVVAQVQAVTDDLPVAAVKTGMLAEAQIVLAVAGLAREGRLPHLVVDPVMVASSGARLASAEAVEAYRQALLPLAEVITPNLPEAKALAGSSHMDQEALALRLWEELGGLVVVKGGHAGQEACIDVACHEGRLEGFSRPRIHTNNVHGSGCTFAAAVAANLAWGLPPLEAVRRAGDFVHAAIAGGAAWELGRGPGPLDQMGWSASAAEQ